MKLNKLDEIFENNNIPNAMIAKVVGKTIETVSRWRNNHRQPPLEDLNKIAEFLRMDIRSLLYESNWPQDGESPFEKAKIRATVNKEA